MGAGARIAAERRLAGLTQQQLADRIAYSVSLVRKIEQGKVPPSPAFLGAVCRVLGVEPEQLTGTPYRTSVDRAEGLEELRRLLAEGLYVRGVDPAPREQLRAALAKAEDAYQADRATEALAELPLLLRQLHAAEDYDALAHAYALAERIARRLGALTLCIPALDRMEWAACRAQNPLYAAQVMIKRARVLMYHGGYDTGQWLIDRAVDAVGAADSEDARVVLGYGHLAGAIVCARAGNADRARDHITEAEALAAGMTGESRKYGTLFGPGNVAVHRVAVALETGDPYRAVAEGMALRLPADMVAPRQGHHWQDVARAALLARKPEAALDALHRARAAAPQQTRLHPGVRETVRGLAALHRRRVEPLTRFAAWLGDAVAV